MNELIELFINNKGKDLLITKDNRLAWLAYTTMEKYDFTRLDELGFVFVKNIRKVVDYYYPETTYKTFCWGYIKIPINKRQVPVYRTEEEIIMRAKPPKKTLQGK